MELKVLKKKIQQYIKYTSDELDLYASTEESCVHKINTNMIVIMGPHCLDNFKRTLRSHLIQHYIGRYNRKLGGIVLEILNIKLINGLAAMRADDPHLHIKFYADIYVFKPEVDAILSGIVKHIARKYVSVTLYRVFTVHLRMSCKLEYDEVALDKEVKFRIRDFNLQGGLPYIEGEILTTQVGFKKTTNTTINNLLPINDEMVEVTDQIKIKKEKDEECPEVIEHANVECTNVDEIEVKKEKKHKNRKKVQINGF